MHSRIIVYLFATLFIKTNAETSIGLFTMPTFVRSYNRSTIDKIMQTISSEYNNLLDDVSEEINDQANKALDEIRDAPSGSEKLNAIARKPVKDGGLRDRANEAKFNMSPNSFKWLPKNSDTNWNRPSVQNGLLVEFSTNAKTRLGTHIFISNTPGIDIFIAKGDEKTQIEAGIGIEFGLHELNYKKTEFEMPYVGMFGLFKFDIYLNNEWKVFFMYKLSYWPIIGNEHSLGTGISVILK